MKTSHISLLIAGLSFVAAGGYLVYAKERETTGKQGTLASLVTPLVVESAGGSSTDANVASLKRDLSRLRAELKLGSASAPDSKEQIENRLMSELTRLSAVVARLESDVGTLREELASTLVDPNEVDFFEAELAQEGQPEAPAGMDELAAAADDEALYRAQELENGFTLEGKDSEWSESTANYVALALTRDEIAGGEVFGTECRSTMCRVEVEHTDEEQLHAFQLWFPHLVGDALPSVSMNTQDLGDGRKSTVIYMARQGYDLPGSEASLQ